MPYKLSSIFQIPPEEVILNEQLQPVDFKWSDEQERYVSFYLDAKEYVFIGEWHWDFQCDAVFCSDVMLSLPSQFIGTRGIFHPDDKAYLQERLSALHPHNISFLQFRIITTFGEVKTLTGRNLQSVEINSIFDPAQEQQQHLRTEVEIPGYAQRLVWQKRATEMAERLTSTGTWYYDTEKNKLYYSDEVFRIYGLPRQSLNAHLNTFTTFIHPDDRDIVSDALATAIKEKVPLHLDFRIITPAGDEKLLHQGIYWEYEVSGRHMLYGVVQEITEAAALEQQAQNLQQELAFQNKVLQLSEHSAHTAHWYINLLTRKTTYSGNMYRLYGFKPDNAPAGKNVFLNFVHPNDRNLVEEVHHKILKQNVCPDIDFRIVRSDGKVRHLRQHGKLVVYGESEMLMVVTVQDISTEVITGQKLAELKQHLALQQAAQHQTEQLADMGSWFWDVKSDKIIWSESLFELLGRKPIISEHSQKYLLHAIHPEDRKQFTDEMNGVLQQKQESTFEIRIIRRSEIRQVRASFRIAANDGTELFIGILQDISEHKQLQQEFQVLAHRADVVTQNMLERTVITDTENVIRLWNKRCEEIYGFKREAVVGKNIFDVLPQLKNETVLALFNRALNGENITLQASKAILRQEHHNLNLVPLKDEQGKVTGILHLLQDVTKEREMQQRLNERLQFIESLLEASIDRIIVMDRYMNYLYCNEKAADYYGLRKEDLIGKNVLEVFPASVNDPSFDHFRKALKGETVRIPAIEGIADEHFYEVFLIPIIQEANSVSAILWIHHDLSVEIKMQRQLRKADELLNTISEAYVELDNQGNFSYVNRRAEEIWNTTKEELLGKNIAGIFQYAIGPDAYRLIIDALEKKEEAAGEFYFSPAAQWLYVSAKPTEEGAIVLFYDISELKRIRQHLEKEHCRMKEAQAIGHIGSFEWEAASDTIYWSDEMYRIHGLEPQIETITFERVMAFIHPDDREEANTKMLPCRTQVCSVTLVHRIMRADGALRIVERKIQSFADQTENVTHLTGSLQDITEKVQAQEELFKNLNLLKQAEEVAGMGTWDYHIDTDTMAWSEGMYQLFDLDPSSKIKKETYLDYVAKEDAQEVSAFLKELRAGAKFIDHIFTIKSKAGVRKVLKVKGIVLKEMDDKPARVLGIDLDITDLVKTEEALRMLNHSLDHRNKDLEAKNEELANFSFIASHDMREPLRKIHTFTDWLMQRENENLSKTGQDYLKRLSYSVERMDRLIDDVLVLTKMQAATLEKTAVDLNAVFSVAKTELAEEIKLSKAKITARHLPVIKGNKSQLAHLFHNLISNAVKFQKPGSVPHLTITGSEATAGEVVQHGLNEALSFIKICFSDNGIGVEDRYREKIFRIFQRLHAQTEYEGTGIGLTICRKVMENHQGLITLESTPGEGSTFCCYFPVHA